MDVALLTMKLAGFGVPSWGTKPFFFEHAVVSSAMDGITARLGVGGLNT